MRISTSTADRATFHHVQLRTRLFLIASVPILAGMAGAVAIAWGLRGAGWCWPASAALAWAFGAALGAKGCLGAGGVGRVLTTTSGRWGTAFLCSSVGGLAVYAAYGAWGEGLWHVGLAANCPFVFAKTRCALIGCCWARRKGVVRRRLERMGLSLQTAECLVTVLVLGIAMLLHEVGSVGWPAALLFLSHAILRAFESFMKHPRGAARRIAQEPTVWLGAALGAAALL